MSAHQLRTRRNILRLCGHMLVMVGSAVAVGMLVNAPELAALDARSLLRVVGTTLAVALGMAAVPVVVVSLFILRRRPDPTAERLSRHYAQLLDESSLNPSRRSL